MARPLHRRALCALAIVLGAALAALAAQPQGTTDTEALAIPNPSRLKGNDWRGRMSPLAASSFVGLPFTLTNSQGYFRCATPVRVGRPKTLEEIQNIVKAYARAKAVGVGHSWWGAQFCSGKDDQSVNLVLTEVPSVLYMYAQKPEQYKIPPLAPPLGYAKGDSPWALDEAARTVTVLGGVGTRTLLDWLNQCTNGASPNGWTLPAFPWYTDQTIAGAVSTATHGSSLQHGSLSQQVVSAQVVLADGSVRDFSGSDPLFAAIATSVGRLGVIVQVTMQVTESVPVRRTTVKVEFAQMVDEVAAVSNAYVAAMAASGNNPADPAVVAALAPLVETEYFPMMPIHKAFKVTYERLPADADIKTATTLAAVRGMWESTAGMTSELTAAAFAGKGVREPAWLAAKANASASADWLPATPLANATRPSGAMAALPKDQAIQQTFASNSGLFAPLAAAEIVKSSATIDVLTRDAPPASVYRQWPKAWAVPPNPLYIVDPFNVTFSAITGTVVGINLASGVYSARAAYAAQLAIPSVVFNDINPYDQYEAAVPMSRAGGCLAKLSDILYGPRQASKGFRVPGLVRFTSADRSLLSPSNDIGHLPSEPVMYFNMEDHTSYDTKKPNEEFMAVFSALVFDPACGGRMHWGKAGWPTLHPCYNGASTAPQGYSTNWCAFGCGATTLDPFAKFRSTWNGWTWAATNAGAPVPFDTCCLPDGTFSSACVCAASAPC